MIGCYPEVSTDFFHPGVEFRYHSFVDRFYNSMELLTEVLCDGRPTVAVINTNHDDLASKRIIASGPRIPFHIVGFLDIQLEFF